MDLNFDPMQVEGDFRGQWQPLPEGTYRFVIDAAEEVPTKNGAGSYLQLDYRVMEGEHADAKYTARLNLNNANEKAVQIARIELREVCLACGITKLTSEHQLLGKVFRAKIKQRKRKDDPEKIENYIGEYFAAQAKPSASAAPPAESTPPKEMW